MSELISTHKVGITLQKRLMATASAVALTVYVASTSIAQAVDAGRPTVWIELGGQLEMMQGLSDPFTAPFMSAVADVGLNSGKSFIKDQRPVRSAFGLEGRAMFRPEDSEWSFSANVRYGRSNAKRHVHEQTTTGHIGYLQKNGHKTGPADLFQSVEEFRDVDAPSKENHFVLDFSVGRDVGVGLLGHEGESQINAGVRFGQFDERTTVGVYNRPIVSVAYGKLRRAFPTAVFPYQYTMVAHAERSFRGLGPSLSWNASAEIVGNRDNGEFSIDWGLNAAVLFGRQKAKTDHATQAYHRTVRPVSPKYPANYAQVYDHGPYHATRSRGVAVPNLGGFAGFSVKYPNAKISVGYRADFFFGAVDAGIDARHTKDLGFNGPFATISFGLGG